MKHDGEKRNADVHQKKRKKIMESKVIRFDFHSVMKIVQLPEPELSLSISLFSMICKDDAHNTCLL